MRKQRLQLNEKLIQAAPERKESNGLAIAGAMLELTGQRFQRFSCLTGSARDP